MYVPLEQAIKSGFDIKLPFFAKYVSPCNDHYAAPKKLKVGGTFRIKEVAKGKSCLIQDGGIQWWVQIDNLQVDFDPGISPVVWKIRQMEQRRKEQGYAY